jgi:hypothetical protein
MGTDRCSCSSRYCWAFSIQTGEGCRARPTADQDRLPGRSILAVTVFRVAGVVTDLELAVPQPGAPFFPSGFLVFGGGHIVLPLLQAEVSPSG